MSLWRWVSAAVVFVCTMAMGGFYLVMIILFIRAIW